MLLVHFNRERNIPVSSLVDIVAARPPHHAPPEDFTDSAAPYVRRGGPPLEKACSVPSKGMHCVAESMALEWIVGELQHRALVA